MLVRCAEMADAEQAASVLRRSIRELCALDHGGDEQTLAQWLRNKTPETVRSWVDTPDMRILVAEENGVILGVASASRAGKITLNYVAPEARFQGVSKALLTSLEAYLRDLGWAHSTLISTRTAYPFYLAMGYHDAADPEAGDRLSGQPMRKALS